MLCKVAFGELAHSISVLRVQTLVYCDLTNYALLLLRTHGRGSIYPPLYRGGGMNLRVIRGLKSSCNYV